MAKYHLLTIWIAGFPRKIFKYHINIEIYGGTARWIPYESKIGGPWNPTFGS